MDRAMGKRDTSLAEYNKEQVLPMYTAKGWRKEED
jgi:hypothetical protein